jgi:lysozyme
MLFFGLMSFFNGTVSNTDTSNSNVVTSTGLLGFIERHEGFAATGYRGADYQNVTIGYGHVVEPGENLTSLTPQQADTLLKNDLAIYEVSVNKEFADTKLTQFQHDALVDFAYGLGPYIWPKASRLVNDIKSGASADVLKSDFTAWNMCNGNSVIGLYNRRYDDWKLFCYGDYNSSPDTNHS